MNEYKVEYTKYTADSDFEGYKELTETVKARSFYVEHGSITFTDEMGIPLLALNTFTRVERINKDPK